MAASPFRLMFIALVVSIAGISGIMAVFFSAHPYFSPYSQQQLPRGWIDEHNYVSSNYSVSNGETVRDVFSYAGVGGQSTIIFAVQPLNITTKGDIEIKFNGIPLGQVRIEEVLVANTSIASCCSVTLVSAGVDNVMEITSRGFEGYLRYLIIIPTGRP